MRVSALLAVFLVVASFPQARADNEIEQSPGYESTKSRKSTKVKEESWPFYHWPMSSANAKKRGEFLFEVKAKPNSFTWEGHKVYVDDCWKQRCDTVYYLFFKFNMDGTATAEHRIFKDSGLSLAFQHDGDSFPNAQYGIQDYCVVPSTRILKALFGSPSTYVVHSVQLVNGSTKNVRLRVGTLKEYKFANKHLERHPTEDPNWRNSLKPTMSDTILDFDLSEQ